MHITFDMFGNKSRNEKAFDHRTKSEALRQMAGELHDAEVEAINAEGDDWIAKTEAVYHKYMEFISLEDAVDPHKTSWVRRYKKLDFDQIKAILPDFTEIEFKCWSSRPEDDENKEMLMLKFGFRKAFEKFRRSNDDLLIRTWDAEQKAFYKR